MKNTETHTQQKPMPWIAFQFMRMVMSVKKRFRNIEEEIGLVGIKEGDTVLDYGCGPGYNTLLAARKVGAAGIVVALDISPLAIQSVTKKAARAQMQNIRAVYPQTTQNEKDAVFDVVFLHNTLPLIKDKIKSLEEIARLLKKGGRLSFMSRTGSRIFGKNSMSNRDVSDYLENKLGFRLMTEKKGHLIFEKI
jgi:ubiquinone/menaquinone biosynthesis C-methylase UbiE